MQKVAFNITENKESGLHTIRVLIENCDPYPIIDGLYGWFETEMCHSKIEYKGPVCSIEFVTDNMEMAKILRQSITEYYFEQEITNPANGQQQQN